MAIVALIVSFLSLAIAASTLYFQFFHRRNCLFVRLEYNSDGVRLRVKATFANSGYRTLLVERAHLIRYRQGSIFSDNLSQATALQKMAINPNCVALAEFDGLVDKVAEPDRFYLRILVMSSGGRTLRTDIPICEGPHDSASGFFDFVDVFTKREINNLRRRVER
jgi:hypothetical protein